MLIQWTLLFVVTFLASLCCCWYLRCHSTPQDNSYHTQQTLQAFTWTTNSLHFDGTRYDNIHNVNSSIFALLDGIRSYTTKDTFHRIIDSNDDKSNDDKRNDTSSTITAFGYSDYYHNIPMKTDAHFPIASNSKLYTTVAIYQLQEQGLLDVNTDIATMLDQHDLHAMGLSIKRYCPRLKYSWKCQTITLRHLLSMSSGIYPALNCDTNQNPESCHREPYFINEQGSIAKTVGTFLTEPLIFIPGTKYHYSNPNFILATYFIEKYSNITFRDYLQENIVDRVGLKNTYYDYFNGVFHMDNKRPRQFYKYYNGTIDEDNPMPELLSVGTDTVQLDLGVAAGTGGIISTASDEIKFWFSLFYNITMKSQPLLQDPKSLNSILTPWTLIGKSVIRWKTKTYPIWIYYTQGVSIICLEEYCSNENEEEKNRNIPDNIKWIVYEGGTMTVHTGNVLDYKFGVLSQLWTSTIVTFPPSVEEFQRVIRQQHGLYLESVEHWIDPRFVSNIPWCLQALLEHYPPDKQTNK